MINRRGFLRGLATAALAAAARVYPTPAAPAVVESAHEVMARGMMAGADVPARPWTLVEWARELDPERTAATIATLLGPEGPGPLDDIVWVEAP